MKRYIYETDFIDDSPILLGVPVKEILQKQKEIEIDFLMNPSHYNKYLVYRIDKELKQAMKDLANHLNVVSVLCPDAYFPIYHDVLLKGNHVGIGFVWCDLGKYPLIWSDIPIAGLYCSGVNYPVVLED